MQAVRGMYSQQRTDVRNAAQTKYLAGQLKRCRPQSRNSAEQLKRCRPQSQNSAEQLKDVGF